MNNEERRLAEYLAQLRLCFIQENYQTLADQAAREQWTHQQYLGRLLEGESQRRQDRSIARRIAEARFPIIKTLDQFDWNWPKKINRPQATPPASKATPCSSPPRSKPSTASRRHKPNPA